MTNFLTPLLPEYGLQIPQSTAAWVGWAVWLVVLAYLSVRFRDWKFRFDRGSLAWLALLSVLILAFTPFLGVPVKTSFSAFGESTTQPHLMFLAALPWLAAGGILGMVPSVLLAGLSGVLLGYLDTHHIFTSLLFMSAALVFTLSVRQKYEAFSFKLLRNPLVAALGSALVVAPLAFLALILDSNGDLASRMLAALSRFPAEFIAIAGMLLIGGAVCVAVNAVTGDQWGGTDQTAQSPVIQSLGFKFAVVSLPLALILLFALIANQWSNANETARRSLLNDMTGTVDLASESLPEFIAAGETMIEQIAAAPELVNAAPENLAMTFETLQASNTFFDRTAFLNLNGELLAVAPPLADNEVLPSSGEQAEIAHLLSGGSVQPGFTTDHWISFFAPVKDSTGQILGVLLGRTSLRTSPLLRSLTARMADLSDVGGAIGLIDASGRVVFHTDPERISTVYSGSTFYTATYFETVGGDGFRNLEYYLPIPSIGWAVVASVPVQSIQLQALRTVTPLLTAGLAVIVLVAGVAILMFAQIDRDVNRLAEETAKMTRGDFVRAGKSQRYSSGIKNLGEAFQVMQGNLRSRLQTQSELLSVSERITGQLKLRDSLQVILVAALDHGISSARIVLLEEAQPSSTISEDQKFGMGKDAHALSPLDEDVLTVTRVRGQWIMRNDQISKNFHLAKGMPRPALMVSIPLRWRNKLLGTFWLAADRRGEISDQELVYFTDLAQKAATAVINSKAFDETLTTRKRLEAILKKLADPVVIADNHRQVIYVNDAVKHLPGLDRDDLIGQSLDDLLKDEDWGKMLSEKSITPQSEEIQTSDGNTYFLTVEPVAVDGQKIGLACIFKDITDFKQQDALKTEFVTTVSHELRSPLTLIHGYAKILRLTGNLNDQQEIYISNIIDGVEELRTLVRNLLDLGRLETGDALKIEEVPVGVVVKRVMDTMGTFARQKNIEVDIALPDAPVFIEADPTFLVQAVKNLVENAIKFSKQGGSVILRVHQQAQSVLFTVEDQGPGIAPLDQRKIFKRFFRPESKVGADDRSGSGLGLAIVKSIAERHGGKVWFESKLGEGSSFYLQIPVLQRKKAD
jgi:PAS domain S-box-containing protein